MVNHKCPALFLLTLQSQQLPAYCAPLSSAQIPSSLPCCDPQGMGKWAEEEEMQETGLCGHVLALRRQFPCQGVHVQRRGKSGCLHIPAFGSCCLSCHMLPLPYFLVCVCV